MQRYRKKGNTVARLSEPLDRDSRCLKANSFVSTLNEMGRLSHGGEKGRVRLTSLVQKDGFAKSWRRQKGQCRLQ